MCSDEALQHRFPAHCTLSVLSPSRLKVYRIAQITNHVCEKVGNYAANRSSGRRASLYVSESVAGIRRTHSVAL